MRQSCCGATTWPGPPAAFDGGTITSDVRALLLGATDRAIRLVERFAACFTDHRAAEAIEHTPPTLVGQRAARQVARRHAGAVPGWDPAARGSAGSRSDPSAPSGQDPGTGREVLRSGGFPGASARLNFLPFA